MQRAVTEFERSIKHVDKKLDTLEWKVRILEKNDVLDKSSDSAEVPIYQILTETSQVNNDYDMLKQEITENIQNMEKTGNCLSTRIEDLNQRFNILKEVVEGIDSLTDAYV